LVVEDQVAEMAVTSADRLTRLGQKYLATPFDSIGVTLTILETAGDKTPEQDLTARGLRLGAESWGWKPRCRQAILSSFLSNKRKK
jgi:hypothetical protein